MFGPRFGFTSPSFRAPFPTINSGPPPGAFYGPGIDGPMFPMRPQVHFGPPVPPFGFPRRMPMPPRPVRFVPPNQVPFLFDGPGPMSPRPIFSPSLCPPPPPPMLRLGKRAASASALKRPPNKSPKIPLLNINLNDEQYPHNFVQIVCDLMCAQCSSSFVSQRIAIAHYNSQRHQESLGKLGLPKGEIWPTGTGPKVP